MGYREEVELERLEDASFFRTVIKIGGGCVLGLILLVGSCAVVVSQYK